MMHDVIYDILEPSSFQKHGTCWVFSALLSLSLSLSLLSWSLSKLISYAYCLNAYMDIMLRRASKPLYMNIFFLEVLFYPGFLFVFVFVCVFVFVYDFAFMLPGSYPEITENTRFVWSYTSHSGDRRRYYRWKAIFWP